MWNERTCYSNLKQRRACLRHTPYSCPARSLGWESQRFTLLVGLCLRLTQSYFVLTSLKLRFQVAFGGDLKVF